MRRPGEQESSHDGKVVVITGASSGIGRALAHHGARAGWRIVVAARRAEALRTLVEECISVGAAADAVALDVTDRAAVDRLAETAVGQFGRIDAWVNAAGVYMVARFEDTPPEAFDRLIAVNLGGTVNGSRAGLAVFRNQKHGVLINISSMVGGLASPYVPAYAASKWAVRGFTLSLREELRGDAAIHACVVRPASIDTPIFRRAANYTGRELKALAPTYEVGSAAARIAALVTRPKREVIIGRSGILISAAHALAPSAVDRIFASRVPSNQFTGEAAPPTAGNLFESSLEWVSEDGEWT